MVQTALLYLAPNDLYKTEKPYTASFEVGNIPGAKKSNIITETREVEIAPVQDRSRFQLDVNGFCVLKEKTSLTMEDALAKTDEVELRYQAELEAILHRHFPEYTRFEAVDFVVRQRDERFPSEQPGLVKFQQPAAVPHADFTPDGAVVQLKNSFPGQEAHFMNKNFDMLNVWKPLAGPNNDWPLGMCDFTSIAPRDIVKGDALHRDRVGENQILYPNEKHRWYYVPDQEPDDLVVFRNTDSTGKRPIAFHAAFPNPIATGPPRTSCEVRFVAFR